MQLAARKLLAWQDAPLVFLAWLVPATLMLIFAGQPSAPENLHAVVPLAWPLALLFALMAGIAAISAHLMGQRGMLVALSYCAVSLSVLAHFAPGTLSFGAFQLVLLISLIAFCLTAQKRAELAAGAGFCAAALIGAGGEGLAFAWVAVFWTALEWALSSREEGDNAAQRTLYFGYSFVAGTIILGLSSGPSWTVLSACGALSLTHLLPAALVGLGLVHLGHSTGQYEGLTHRLWCLGFLGVIAISAAAAANPSCILTAGLGPEQTTNQGTISAQSAQDAINLYALSAAPLMGLCAACLATIRSKQQRSAWLLVVLSVLLALVLSASDTRYLMIASALAVAPCAWLTLLAGQTWRTRRPTVLAGLLFAAVWLAGISLATTPSACTAQPNEAPACL